MARTSKFEHLKPEVLAEFQKGLQPKDVYGKFPQIPGATIREWHKPFRPQSAPDSANSASQSGKGFPIAHPPASGKQRSHLTLVSAESDEDDSSLSDIEWVKRQVETILRVEKNCAVKIQALNTYLRAVQIEQTMRPTKPDIDFAELSNQELERLASGEVLEVSMSKEMN